MASLIIFLCFSAFMVAVGYQWRRIEEDRTSRRGEPGHAGPSSPANREAVWDGMVGKI